MFLSHIVIISLFYFIYPISSSRTAQFVLNTNSSHSLFSLSFSRNGVVRADGFSVSEQTDEEAVTVWMGSSEDDEDKKRREMDLEMSKSVLAFIGDKFCQLIKTEDIAFTWVKKDSTFVWILKVSHSLSFCLFHLALLSFLSFPFFSSNHVEASGERCEGDV